MTSATPSELTSASSGSAPRVRMGRKASRSMITPTTPASSEPISAESAKPQALPASGEPFGKRLRPRSRPLFSNCPEIRV